MHKTALRLAIAGLCALGSLTSLPTQAQALTAETQITFNIPSQTFEAALLELAKQASLQLAVSASSLPQGDAPRISGKMPIREALGRLLRGTELTYEFVGERTLTITSRQQAGSASLESVSSVQQTERSQALRLAQGDAADESSRSSGGAAQSNDDVGRSVIEEITVTAQKRVERLQDVPVPVTALNASQLAENNQLRLQDYFTKIPGLNFTQGNRSEVNLAIRGISTGFYLNPTVGIVIDDIPYGSSTALGGAYSVPDIDPSELDHIEVLRGPQGTLYGASSIGGLLKFVTVDPSLERSSGRLQVGMSSVKDGDDLGYNVRGSVSVPLSDTFAVRASGFTRRDPGYIDDPALRIDDVNEARVDGGRVAALWQPSETLSLKLSALVQDSHRVGSSQVHVLPGLHDLQQSSLIDSGYYDKKVQIYGATLSARLGSVELTSLTGYSVNESSGSFDITPAFGSATSANFGVSGTPIVENNETTKVTQEIRLSAPLGEHLEWLVGAFYTDEDSTLVSSLLAADPANGAIVGKWFDNSYPTTFEEYAAFATVTVRVSERFDVQFGARQSENRQTYQQRTDGPYVPVFLGVPSPSIIPYTRTDDDSFTYLVTPRFKLSSDLMLYARFASGYRPGGPNQVHPDTGLPRQYAPDTTQSYEAGFKGSVFDRALFLDASVYYIDWRDIQIGVNGPNFSAYNTNGARARSRGVELSFDARPLTGLAIAGWLAWNDAELSEDFPNTSQVWGDAGDRLPYSSRFSASLTVEQEFSLTNVLTGFVGASASYVGDRVGIFVTTFGPPDRQDLPAYTQTDVRAGLRYDSWTMNLIVNNVADERGVLSGGIGSFPVYGFNYIQPRTVGLSLARTF